MQVKERTFSVSNMIFFTFNSQQYFKYFDSWNTFNYVYVKNVQEKTVSCGH